LRTLAFFAPLRFIKGCMVNGYLRFVYISQDLVGIRGITAFEENFTVSCLKGRLGLQVPVDEGGVLNGIFGLADDHLRVVRVRFETIELQ